MRLGRIATAKGLLPLPLAGEGWGGGAAASHAVRMERVSPTRIASFDAMRPLPQAGEVQQVRGQGAQPCPDSKAFRIGSSERAVGFAANGRQQNDTGGGARRRAYQ